MAIPATRTRPPLMRWFVLRFNMANRRRKGRLIVDFMQRREIESVVLVGSSGEEGHENRNVGVVERAVSEQGRIVLALDLAPHRSAWSFVQADGCALPLKDQSGDLALANAVIEHVGDADAQARFVAEQIRAARHWVITTPNRWFPVESHTSAVLRHWSRRWREDQVRFTRLLSRSEFCALLPPDSIVVGHWWSATFTAFSPVPETKV